LSLSYGGSPSAHGPDKRRATAEAETKSTRPADPSLYAGSETCKTCHEEEFKSYDRGPHWKTEKDTRRGVPWQGCEGCPGPGKEHAESGDVSKIIRFTKANAEQASKVCLECHEMNEEHSNFLRSAHLANNVGCNDCHSVHKPKVEQKLLKASQPGLCYSCH